jgi:hypothetical protein
MKKLIAVLLVVVALFALSGCSKKGTCESCGKEDVSLEKVELMGETGYLCEDCAEVVEALGDLGDMF